MATSLSDDEIKKGVEILKEEARLREVINSSFNDFLSSVKDYKKVQKSILQTDIKIKKEQEIITDPKATLDQKKAAEVRLVLLQKYNKELKYQNDLLGKGIADANKGQMALAKGAKVAADVLGNLPNLISQGLGKIRGLGLFEMDKSIKKSALSMGLVAEQADNFSKNIRTAADNTAMIGVGVKELAKIQSDYSEELGKAVQLDSESLTVLGQMAAATGLGAEGTAKMAADMAQQGYSAEETSNFVKETMQDAHNMGLNTTKVVGLVAKNIKMLNQYNFKNGIDGLKKMAEYTAKLGVDMKFAAPFADKLFDIEGAVDMSAQLQVMGGAWAKLADPFHLMYMARNDMAGLTEEIGKATESSVHFNAQKGDFEISAMEMHRLRVIAQQTGISYEELATAGKNAAKATKINGQISIDVKDQATKEFITNSAIWEAKTGKAKIMVGAQPKYLDALNSNDIATLKAEAERKQSLEEYAKQSRTFDDALTGVVDKLKIALIPFVEDMDKYLIPKLDEFVKGENFKKIVEGIEYIVGKVANVVKDIASFIIEHPWVTAGAVLLGKTFSAVISGIGWFNNGLLLAQGFNVGTTGKGGVLSNLMNWLKGGKGAAGEAAAGEAAAGEGAGGAAAAGGAATAIASAAVAGISLLASSAAGWLYDKIVGEKKKSDTWSNNWGKKLGRIAATTAVGAGVGAGAGALFGGVGAAPGALIGGVTGLGKGLYDEFFSEPVNDAIVSNGKITPIDKKDDLIAMKPTGAIANTIGGIGGVNEVKHTFGDLTINGQLVVTTPGGGSVGTDLLKDPSFIRSMTLLVTNEVQKINNGGKNT